MFQLIKDVRDTKEYVAYLSDTTATLTVAPDNTGYLLVNDDNVCHGIDLSVPDTMALLKAPVLLPELRRVLDNQADVDWNDGPNPAMRALVALTEL